LTDFCDGAHYCTYPLFNENPKALQIFLYYDEIEVCNPLGSSKGKHKLGIAILMLNYTNLNMVSFSRFIFFIGKYYTKQA